jgi:hypothetical protein
MSTALNKLRIPIARVAAIGALLLSLPSPAHHSTANFDMAKSNTVTGTVAYFAFTNPHSYFDMDVVDKSGAVRQYKVFTLARVVMVRNEWKPGDLKVGDKVTVTGNPDRKDPQYLYLRSIVFADGRTWNQDKVIER